MYNSVIVWLIFVFVVKMLGGVRSDLMTAILQGFNFEVSQEPSLLLFIFLRQSMSPSVFQNSGF